jgi:hypothetical protein
MSSLTFDKLTYFQKLKDSGIPEAQARAQTDALDEALQQSGADYVQKSEINQFKSDMKLDFQSLENRIQKELAPIRTNITLMTWMLGVIIVTLVMPALKHLPGL